MLHEPPPDRCRDGSPVESGPVRCAENSAEGGAQRADDLWSGAQRGDRVDELRLGKSRELRQGRRVSRRSGMDMYDEEAYRDAVDTAV